MLTPEQQMEVVQRHVTSLMEHFDHVHVFAGRFNDQTGNTATISLGDGNWYARAGQIREWMVEQDMRSADKIRREDRGD